MPHGIGVCVSVFVGLVAVLITGVYRVHEGHVSVTYFGGALQDTLKSPGYHWAMPGLTRHVAIPVRLQTCVVQRYVYTLVLSAHVVHIAGQLFIMWPVARLVVSWCTSPRLTSCIAFESMQFWTLYGSTHRTMQTLGYMTDCIGR